MSVKTIVSELTADDVIPISGPLLAQLANLSHQSSTNCLQIENLLLRRIRENSLNIKLKTLQSIRYLLLHGSVGLVRQLRTHQLSLMIKQHVPLSGASGSIIMTQNNDTTSRLSECRQIASEVLNLLLEPTRNPTAPPSDTPSDPQQTSSLSQGIGSKPTTKQEPSKPSDFIDFAASFLGINNSQQKPTTKFGSLDKKSGSQDYSPVQLSVNETIELAQESNEIHSRAIVRAVDCIVENATMMRYLPIKSDCDAFNRKTCHLDPSNLIDYIWTVIFSNRIWYQRAYAFGLMEYLFSLPENSYLVQSILSVSTKRAQISTLSDSLRQIKSNISRVLSFYVEPSPNIVSNISNSLDLFGGLSVTPSMEPSNDGSCFDFIDTNDVEETKIVEKVNSNIVDDLLDLL
ncbi:hypothetical protein RCL1_008861 [Eukaryota sp. TZLM3-RCL]